MISIDVLARPITELLTCFGSGLLPADGPADALRTASTSIDSVYRIGRTGISDLGGAWTGEAGEAAVAKAEQAQGSAVAISDRGTAMADIVAQASEDVKAGLVELEGILQSFVTIAVAAGPTLMTPPGQLMIIGAALDHLQQALAVVAKVRGQLDKHTADMTALIAPEETPQPAAAQTSPASSAVGDAGAKMAQSGSGAEGQSGGSDPAGAPATGSSAGSGTFDGKGVEITLPDGSTATAPNEKAATAVRAALSQQGVPYEWGGTSPGKGLDCSGLTQYAYQEAGMDIPRLAQEQSVGTPVDAGNLMPGDLAVWDGHVAMVIGNGQLVEAGDPVEVSAIRTSNSGMSFHGFYRPSA